MKNPHEKKETANPCPWCDGTGAFCYAQWLGPAPKRHCDICKQADEYRTCGQCGGSGVKRAA